MVKKLKIQEELKKLKPLELKASKEPVKEEKKPVSKDDSFREEFHDNSVWQSRGFRPEKLAESNGRIESLEKFAQSAPSSLAVSQDSSYTAKNTSGNYTPGADYLSGTKKYTTIETQPNLRPTLSSGSREAGIRMNLPSVPSSGTQQEFNQQRQEFERQQEQYRQELREKSKLPFQRGRGKTEIF